MRVIAGSARGRRLVAPRGDRTRPTSDRVREATFNALGSLGGVGGASVLDLFAGTGAMGIEALSRGAADATFCDTDRGARRVIAENLRITGLADRATIVAADALTYAASSPPVDVAFCDPPYRYDHWDELLAALPAELAVVESDRPIPLPAPWQLVRSRTYGTTVVQLARRIGQARPATGGEGPSAKEE